MPLPLVPSIIDASPTTLIAAVAVVVAGYWTDANLRVNLAWALGIGVVAMYVLSRGIAKAGSSDPEIRDLDDFR